MIRVLVVSALAFAIAGLAACAHHHHHAVAQRSAADACRVAVQQHQNLVGTDIGAIDETTLPANHRVVCFGCMATMEYDPGRFTVYAGPGHKVASLHCG